MKKIRIGNDIRIKFPVSIEESADGQSVNIESLNLSVWVQPSEKIENYEEPYFKSEDRIVVDGRPLHHRDKHWPHAIQAVQLEYKIIDNELHAYWKADEQYALGAYDVVLYNNKGQEGQAVADQVRAIKLVAHTSQADPAYQDEDVEKVVELGKIVIETEGRSAYDLACSIPAIVKGYSLQMTLLDGADEELVRESILTYFPSMDDEKLDSIIGGEKVFLEGEVGAALVSLQTDIADQVSEYNFGRATKKNYGSAQKEDGTFYTMVEWLNRYPEYAHDAGDYAKTTAIDVAAVTVSNKAAELEREEAFNKIILRWAELEVEVAKVISQGSFAQDTVTRDMIVNKAIDTSKLEDGAVSYPKLNLELQGDINDVREHETYIPADTAVDNKLVNETRLAEALQGNGHDVCSNAAGSAFATYADLHAPYYYDGKPYVPQNNDRAVVIADETPEGGGGTSMYRYSGTQWIFFYKINNTPFTTEQWAAINSTIQKGWTDDETPRSGGTVKQIVLNKEDLVDLKTLKVAADPSDTKIDYSLQSDEKADGTRTIDSVFTVPSVTSTSAGLMPMQDKTYLDDDKTTKLAQENITEDSLDIITTTDGNIKTKMSTTLKAAELEHTETDPDTGAEVVVDAHAGLLSVEQLEKIENASGNYLQLKATHSFSIGSVPCTMIENLEDVKEGDYTIDDFQLNGSTGIMTVEISNAINSYTLTTSDTATKTAIDGAGIGATVTISADNLDEITVQLRNGAGEKLSEMNIPCADADNYGVMSNEIFNEHEDFKTTAFEQSVDASNVFFGLKSDEETINTTTTLAGANGTNAGAMTSQTYKEIEDIKTATASNEQATGGVKVKVQSNEGYFNAQTTIDNASDGANGMMSKEDKVALDNLKTIDLTSAQTADKATVTMKTDGDTIKKVAEIGLTDADKAGLLSPTDKEKYDKALIKDEGGIVSADVEFTGKTVVLAPTEDMEAATKKYVDDNGGKVKEILIQEGAATAGLKEPENKRITLAVPTKTSHLTNDGTGDATNPYTLKEYVDAHDGVNGVSATAEADKVTVKVSTPSAEATTKEAQGDIPAATTTSAGVMTADQVKSLEGKQNDMKVKIVDMEAADFSPVLNTYYQHSYDAATANTYMKGMIYRYKNVTTEKLDPFGQSYDPKQYETVPTMLPIDGSGSGGGSGVSSYNELTNKPQVNSVELAGNVSSASLNIPYNDLKADTIPMINGVKVMGQKKADGSNIDGEYYGLADLNDFNELKQIVEGLGGALVYIGDYTSDASETDLKGGLLSNFVFQETGGAAQNGYLVKVHATTGGFRGEYLYVSNGSSIATWKLYSESESVTPATYTTKGVVQIKENAGLKLTDGVLEAEVTADNDKTLTNKYISGSTEAGNVLRNFDTDIFKDGVKVSVLDDTCTHDQIATAKATYDAFVASGAADVSKKLDKVTYSEAESGNNTGLYAHTAEQQKTIPIITGTFPDDVNNSQVPSAKIVKDNLDTKLDKITVGTKGLYFHDGTTQGEKLIVTTIGTGSTDDEIPTAKAAYANQAGKLDARTNSASEVYTHEGDVQGGKTIVTSIDENSTDNQVPTAKAAYSNQADKLKKNETTTPNQAITPANIGAATKLTNNDWVYANYGTTQKSLEMNAILRTVGEVFYPVGAYYISSSATNPKDVFGFGTWEAVTGAIYGVGDQVTAVGAVSEQLPKLTFTGTSHTHSFDAGVFNKMEGEAKIWGGGIDTCSGVLGKASATNSCGGSGTSKNSLYFGGTPSYKTAPYNKNATAGGTISDAASAMASSGGHVLPKGYAAYIWRRTS